MMKIVSAIMIVAALVISNIAYSSSTTSQLMIQATVLPTLSFKIVRSASGLKITRSDVKNGYVDVPSGTVYTISTNSQHGYVLVVSAFQLQGKGGRNALGDESNARNNATSYVYTSITVYADGNTYQVLPDSSVDILLSTRGITPDTKRLDFRFSLAPSAKESTYPWPIRLAATPM